MTARGASGTSVRPDLGPASRRARFAHHPFEQADMQCEALRLLGIDRQVDIGVARESSEFHQRADTARDRCARPGSLETGWIAESFTEMPSRDSPVAAAGWILVPSGIDVRAVRAIGVAARARSFAQHVEGVHDARIRSPCRAPQCVRQRSSRTRTGRRSGVSRRSPAAATRCSPARLEATCYRRPRRASSASAAVWPAMLERSRQHARDEVAVEPDLPCRNAASFSAISQVCVSASGARRTPRPGAAGRCPRESRAGNEFSRFCADSRPGQQREPRRCSARRGSAPPRAQWAMERPREQPRRSHSVRPRSDHPGRATPQRFQHVWHVISSEEKCSGNVAGALAAGAD